MQALETLKYGHFYHIYNHSVGERNLFCDRDNYEYFLNLYDKYIFPIAETYVWVLMPNHFHFLLRIIEEDISQETPDRVGNPVRGGKVAEPSRHFSNLFNSYAQAFNKKHETQGALFERPFKRKQINDETYLRQVILYIHNNPVYHDFCKQPGDYLWSSYRSCISLKPTKIHRKAVIGLFEDVSNFKYMHQQKLDVMQIEKWLEISYL